MTGPDEAGGGTHSQRTDSNHADTQLSATATQLFAGLQIGLPSLDVMCAHCKTHLGEGETVSVYAYRPAETTRWSLGRVCCRQCAPDQITTPTLGTAECRFTARLAVVSDVVGQRHRLCLADPTPTAVAPPAKGTSP